MDYAVFFKAATGFDAFPYQLALGAQGLPEMLEVPTGFGKTEAVVLAWLWQHHAARTRQQGQRPPLRLVYCLPMRVLVEQTAARVKACIARFEAAHGAGSLPLLADDVHVLLGGSVARDFESNIDKPCILIGTQDQLLSRALNRGYAMSRFLWPVHFALLNNDCQWVFDEVQLMGVGASTSMQLQCFRDTFGTHGASRTLWMSATLEASRLKTVDAGGGERIRVGITAADRASSTLAKRHAARKQLLPAKFGAHEAKACAKQILEAHVVGSLTLVVVNRVRRAQGLFTALSSAAGAVPVRLVHSRFRPADRRAVQAEAFADGWAGIVVATQAVEAGVDISARTLFTEIAPWSSLVQRFGRLNRRGEWAPGEARAFWMDLDEAEDAAAPYAPADIASARERMAGIKDVGPATLGGIEAHPAPPALPFVRRRDLLQLFDTEPDLAGHDLDVSAWIRDAQDVDVQVAWRRWDGDAPPGIMPEPTRDELCSVAVGSLAKFLNKQRPWRWDGQSGAWTICTKIVPGMTLVVQDTIGGYADALGWTGEAKHEPSIVAAPSTVADADEADPFTFRCGRFVELAQHAEDAAEAMRTMSTAGLSSDVPWHELELAARWHDAGKAHAAFQQMLLAPLPAEDPRRLAGPWAKSDHSAGRNARRGFRHELASALALLQHGGSDLQAYVVAAHHGKVRLTLRARPGEVRPRDGRLFAMGVWDGDELPALSLGAGVECPTTQLRLDLMQLGDGPAGPSWLERMSALLERHGPFRLAFLEALVRVADWRATQRYVASASDAGACHA